MGAKGSCIRETLEDVVEVVDENGSGPQEEVDLFQINHEELDDIPARDKRLPCRIVDVYDGDSFTGVFHYNNENYKIKIRLLGVDCPEMNPRNIDDEELKELEKQAARKCKAFVEHHILEKILTLELKDHDKYGGRYLCNLYLNEDSLSNFMINQGYARSYQGEKKTPWTKEELGKEPFL